METQHTRLSVELKTLLAGNTEDITIRQLSDKVGDRGFGLLLLILALPSALPVPAAGYSVPFGILLLALAFQMILGRQRPVFPKRFESISIKPGMADKMLGSASWVFSKIEWLIRPRLKWIGLRGGRIFMGVIVLIMACLMMIPIPLTNTAPAFVVFLIGIGLTEDDGAFAIGACIVGVFAVALYASLIYAIILYGPEVAVQVKETIKEFLGV